MAAEPLDLSPIVTRIRDEADPTLISHAAMAPTTDVALEFGKRTPAAYVLRARGVAGREEGSSLAVIQLVEATVEVVIVARRYGDAMGEKALDALRASRAELWRVLIGWTLPGAAFPFALDRFEDGAPGKAGDPTLYGVDRFRTAFQLRAL